MDRYVTYDYSDLKLEAWEHDMIKHFIKIADIVHDIWDKQVLPDTGEATFYDKELTKDEILAAGIHNPQILSPYSVVVKEGDDIKAISYREAYSEDIDKIVKLLREAGDISQDAAFTDYMCATADAYDKGNFDESLILYLENRDTKFDFLMGPIETYLDKVIGIKKAFQFNFRILKEDDTAEVCDYMNVVRQADILKPSSSMASSISPSDINLRVEHGLIFAGRQGTTRVVGTNLPNETDLLKKYGSKITIYTNSVSAKFDRLLKPIYEMITVEPESDRTTEELTKAYVEAVALHEIVEAVVKYEDVHERLSGLRDVVREFTSTMYSLKTAQYHVLKGLVNSREYENLLVSTLIDTLVQCGRSSKDLSSNVYAQGYAILISIAEKEGGISFVDGKMKVDLKKLSNTINKLADTSMHIWESGSYEDAKEFLSNGENLDLDNKLPGLHELATAKY